MVLVCCFNIAAELGDHIVHSNQDLLREEIYAFYGTVFPRFRFDPVDTLLKKNLNASKPSEHPPDKGGKLSKRLGRNIYKTAKKKPLHGISSDSLMIVA